jgi:hypothetical protein
MNHSIRVRRFLIVLATILAFSTSIASGSSTKGKVKAKTYYSPAQNFSVPVPEFAQLKLAEGQVVDDFDKSKSGFVSFYNLFGAYLAIHYMPIASETVSLLQQPESREKALAGWLQESAMPTWFLRASPNSKIVRQAMTKFEDMGALTALVEIPEGSVLQNMATRKRLDSSKAVVVFPKNGYMYILAGEIGGSHASEEEWLKEIEQLKPFFRSISFQ